MIGLMLILAQGMSFANMYAVPSVKSIHAMTTVLEHLIDAKKSEISTKFSF